MPHADHVCPYELMADYPHMRPADEAIWTRFIQKNPSRFEMVIYDMGMGDAADAAPELPQNILTAWHDLTRWKCDVVAEDRDAVYTIEVKPNANAKALGQALAYAVLYKIDHPGDKPVVPVVLTDVIHNTTAQAAKEMGILLWQA